METRLQDAGPHERLLTVSLPEAELESAMGAAARRIAKEIKVKGFRPGKAPRQIVESMVGTERVREEALQAALPDIVSTALNEAELNPAVTPTVSDTRDTEDGIEVDIVVTLWPTVENLPIYEGRRIVIDAQDVSEDEVAAQLDRVRGQYAELEDVTRPADTGDYAMMDLGATRRGLPVPEASATDLLYEVGSQSFIPGLDDALLGSSPGDIKQTEAQLPEGFGDHAGDQVELRILVKGVRAKRLPELTDDWVSEVSEFDTVAEFRSELHSGLVDMKRTEAATEFRNRLIEELTTELDVEVPEAIVNSEMDGIVHRLVHQLEASGIDLANYLRITGQDEGSFLDDLRKQADQNLRSRVLLESVAEVENIQVEAEELDEVIEEFAAAANEPADEYREQLARSGQVVALAGDILRQKAFDHLVANVTAVDADGEPLDLEGPARDDEPAPEQTEDHSDGGADSAEVEETE